MINPNCWRQPIPTDFADSTEFSMLEKMIIAYLFLKAHREDRDYRFIHGNKTHVVKMKRGQVLFRVKRLAEEFDISHKKLKTILRFISASYTKLQIEGRPFGTVVTINNYDELVKMQIEGKTKAKRKQNESKPSKKKVKTNKNIKREETLARIKNISDQDLKTLVDKYEVTEKQVKSKVDSLITWEGNGKYSDFWLTLQNWLSRDYGLRETDKLAVYENYKVSGFADADDFMKFQELEKELKAEGKIE